MANDHTTAAKRAKLRQKAEKLFERLRLEEELAATHGRPVNEGERETAHRMLVKALTELDIEEHELGRRDGIDAEAIDRHDYMVGLGNATRGGANLVARLARLFGGAAMQSAYRWGLDEPNEWGQTTALRLTIYARPSDWARTKRWADHLIPQMMLDMARERPHSRLAYSYGWAGKVGQRIADLYEEERPPEVSSSVALARIDADAVMRSENDLANARRQSVDAEDLRRGMRAGARARLPADERSLNRGARPALRPATRARSNR